MLNLLAVQYKSTNTDAEAVVLYKSTKVQILTQRPLALQIRVATLLTRAYAGKTAVDGGQLGGGEADEVFAGAAYGGWARDYSRP